MRFFNSKKQHIGIFFANGVILSAKFETKLSGVYYRIFKRPNGSYIGQLSMEATGGWEFICSVNGSNVRWM